MAHTTGKLCLGAVILPILSANGGELERAGQRITVPEGFEVEVAAAPPLVLRPISADFDELGRLYVTDSSGSNDKVEKQLVELPHRVLRLEDADGDGVFDRSTVFADRMMFPEGALWFDGSLYVAAPPSIWRLKDTDGDGVADERVEWFQGKTCTGCANDLHGPFLGLDGWIYWAKGAFAKQTYDRAGKPPFVTRASHIFRSRPEGTGIEHVMTGGMDNPVDVVFTPEGERIFSCTFLQNPEAGRRDGLIHAIYGGVYGKVNDVLDEHKQTGGLLPPLVHLGPAAPCGLTRYESSAFGPDHRDSLFACLFNLHKVTRHTLEAEGATYRTRDEDFLVGDSSDFHPTDVLEDADGSLLVLDTGGWYKLCCPTSQLAKPDVLGAIYRVRKTGTDRPADPRGLRLAWESMDARGLARLLGDPRPAVRARAIREIARKGEAAVPFLASITGGSATPEARRNAVWSLTRIDGDAAREGARAALRDADASVRHAAVHAAGVRRDAGALPVLLGLLGEGTPAIRRAAAEAIGRIGSKEAVPSLLAAAASTADRIIEHSIIYALIEIADPAGTPAGLAAESPAARRAALIALDQMDGGGLEPSSIAPLLASSDPIVKETASWIASRRPEWGPALAGFFRAKLSQEGLDAAEADVIEGQLASLARDGEIQKLMASILDDPATSRGARRLILRAMARARPREAPVEWASRLERVLSSGDPDLAREAVFAARALPWSKETAPRLSAPLLLVARDASAPADLRLDALAALPTGSALDRVLFDFLKTRLDPELPVLVRDAAATALARARLEPAELAELAESLRTAGPLEVARLLPAFEGLSDEGIGKKLLGALKESPGSAGINAGSLKQVLAKFPDPIRLEGAGLIEALREDAPLQAARLDELAASLKSGDVRRGQTVFNGPKAACSSCHAIGYLGGKVGPDLTKIGEVRTERDLLESLLYPSASFVRSYEPLLIIRKDGEILNGVVRSDTRDEIVLATGPTTEVRIPRPEIADVLPGTVSVMPQGLEKLITTEELADLLAFLKATRWHAQ